MAQGAARAACRGTGRREGTKKVRVEERVGALGASVVTGGRRGDSIRQRVLAHVCPRKVPPLDAGAGSQRARGTCSGAGCAVEGHSSDSIWNSWEVWRACSSSALREGRCSERTEKKLKKGMCWGADPWERRRLEIIIEGASLVYSTVTA